MEILVIILAVVAINLAFDGEVKSIIDDDTEEYIVPAQVFVPKDYNSLKGGGLHVIFSADKQDYVVSTEPQLPTLKTPYQVRDSKPQVAIDNTNSQAKLKNESNFMGSSNEFERPVGNDEKPLSDNSSDTKSVADIPLCSNKTFKVHFENDKSNLDEKANYVIEKATSQAIACGNTSITVYGHATKTGSISHNMKLATKRAQEVGTKIIKTNGLVVNVMNPLSSKDTIKPERVAIIELEG